MVEDGEELERVKDNVISVFSPMEFLEYDDRIVMVQNLAGLGEVSLSHRLEVGDDGVRTIIVTSDDGNFGKDIRITGMVSDDYEFSFNNNVLEIVIKKVE